MDYSDFFHKLKKTSFEKSDDEINWFLNMLKNDVPFCFVRFNDGEIKGIKETGSVIARGAQTVNESLNKELINTIQHTQKNYYIGLACSSCFENLTNIAQTYIKQPKEYQTKATLLTNRNWNKFISEFSNVVRNKKIVWISGKDQNLDFLVNVMGLNIIKHITHSVENTWDEYNKIYDEFINFKKENNDFDVVMISSGPTSRILSKYFFEFDHTKTYIDIGSTFDPFTRNVWHNCHKGWLDTGFNKTNKCKICN